MLYFKFISLICMFYMINDVDSHGRLVSPPGRSSMWRYGFDTPENFNDNQLYCGGFQHQQDQDGRCGLCGDPFDGPLENEAGGKYATDAIAKCIAPSARTLDVSVQLTANHLGYFEFKLCENNDYKKKFTQHCLDKHPLKVSGNGSTKYYPGAGVGFHNFSLEIPVGLTCQQCVLQWKYHTGNSWGVDDDGKGCIGCGPQEEFYACSDIRISNDCSSSQHKLSTKLPTTIKPTVRLTTSTPKATSTTIKVTSKPTTKQPTLKPSTTTPSRTTVKIITTPTSGSSLEPTTAPRTTVTTTTIPPRSSTPSRTTVKPSTTTPSRTTVKIITPTSGSSSLKPTTASRTTVTTTTIHPRSTTPSRTTVKITKEPTTSKSITKSTTVAKTTVKATTKTSTEIPTTPPSTERRTSVEASTSRPTTIKTVEKETTTSSQETTVLNLPKSNSSTNLHHPTEQSKQTVGTSSKPNTSEATTILSKIITAVSPSTLGIVKSTTSTIRSTTKHTEPQKSNNGYQGKILRICEATGDYKNDTSVTDWCMENCNVGFCPRTHCACQDSIGNKVRILSCRGYGEYVKVPGIDKWCQINCLSNSGCPLTHCICEQHYVYL